MANAKEILAAMKPCFGKSAGFDAILIEDGIAKGYDMSHSVAMPFPCEHNFTVKAADFIKVVSAADPEKLKFDIDDSNIIVKSGRSRTKIPLMSDYSRFIPEPEGEEWTAFPPDLLKSLAIARRFLAKDPEDPHNKVAALTLYVTAGHVYGTNAHILARVETMQTGCAGLNLPFWAFDFLAKADIAEWQHTENYAAFRFKEGGWYRTQLIEVNYPIDVLNNLLDKLKNPLGPEIAVAGFYECFKEAVAFGATHVKLSKTGITARKEQVECHVETELPLQRETIWDASYIDALCKTAQFFYPEPLDEKDMGFFKGPGIDGIVMAQRV